jgi:hypothetical protein
MEKPLSLVEILSLHPTDKNTTHSYGETLEKLFAPYRDTAEYVLEIGVDRGASLRAFRQYFKNAVIVGMDNRPEAVFAEDRIFCYQGDQNLQKDLTSLCNALSISYDVIIDDGNHQPVSQVMGIFNLWPHLKPGGLYVVEDVQEEKFFKRFSLFPDAELYDLRSVKGRSDDMLVTIRKRA